VSRRRPGVRLGIRVEVPKDLAVSKKTPGHSRRAIDHVDDVSIRVVLDRKVLVLVAIIVADLVHALGDPAVNIVSRYLSP